MMNTIDDLGHPLILETAKNLAFKQVGLGFCAPQDHEDLAQDLLLYLCRQFSRYTGALPLVTWACRLLRGRINAINRRLLGVPSPSEQRRTGQASVAALSPKREPCPRTAVEPPEGRCLDEPTPEGPAGRSENEPTRNQQGHERALVANARPETVVVFRSVRRKPEPAPIATRSPASRSLEDEPPDQDPPDQELSVQESPCTLEETPEPDRTRAKSQGRSRLLAFCAKVGSWWQRLRATMENGGPPPP